MRSAQHRIQRGPVSRVLSVPAPVGGLNARDAEADMPATDAIKLDNMFPSATSVDLRLGSTAWSTGYPAHVESLMTYNGPTGSKLFAASGTAFYDATAQGAVGAAVVSGLANARWQHAGMGTPGGQFMYCVNGADYAELYNGTAWAQVTAVSVIAITGIDTRLLIHVNQYANRLFFVEKDSCRFWYLPVNSVGGAALSFDLAPLFTLGGYLMAMATWTIDNANGMNEYAVFLSSQGEVVVYSGTDPAVAANWVKNGRFRIGRPIGRRCYVRVGSDLILVTADGFVPLSKSLLTERAQLAVAISDKITNLVNNDVTAYSGNFGWQPLLHPIGNMLLVNVPQVPGKQQYQYVMNTTTGAWCRFTNWNANCFELLGDGLYYGGNLGSTANSAMVVKAATGYADSGGYIFGEVKQAFNYFNAPGRQKEITMAKPVFLLGGNLQAALAMDMDFADSYPTATPTFSGGNGTLWNTALWNTFPWSSSSNIVQDWQSVSGVGNAGALHMRIVNNRSATKWQSTDFLYMLGGYL